jgi:hypothetical protein
MYVPIIHIWLEYSKGDPSIFLSFFGQCGKNFLLQISTIHPILRRFYPYNRFFKISKKFISPNSKFWKNGKKIDMNVGKLAFVDISWSDVRICLSPNGNSNPCFNFFPFFQNFELGLIHFSKFWKNDYRGKNVLELDESWRSAMKSFCTIDQKIEGSPLLNLHI